jgi:hypothetical protein
MITEIAGFEPVYPPFNGNPCLVVFYGVAPSGEYVAAFGRNVAPDLKRGHIRLETTKRQALALLAGEG